MLTNEVPVDSEAKHEEALFFGLKSDSILKVEQNTHCKIINAPGASSVIGKNAELNVQTGAIVEIDVGKIEDNLTITFFDTRDQDDTKRGKIIIKGEIGTQLTIDGAKKCDIELYPNNKPLSRCNIITTEDTKVSIRGECSDFSQIKARVADVTVTSLSKNSIICATKGVVRVSTMTDESRISTQGAEVIVQNLLTESSIRTNSGPVTVTNASGEGVVIKTISGAVVVRSLSHCAKIESESGTITTKYISSAASISSNQGPINAHYISGDRVQINSAGLFSTRMPIIRDQAQGDQEQKISAANLGDATGGKVNREEQLRPKEVTWGDTKISTRFFEVEAAAKLAEPYQAHLVFAAADFDETRDLPKFNGLNKTEFLERKGGAQHDYYLQFLIATKTDKDLLDAILTNEFAGREYQLTTSEVRRPQQLFIGNEIPEWLLSAFLHGNNRYP